MLRNGELDDQEIEIELLSNSSSPMKSMEIPGMPGGMMGMINLEKFLVKVLDKKKKKGNLLLKSLMNFFSMRNLISLLIITA